MKKYILYTRTSTKDVAERHYSLESQEQRLRAYAAHLNLDVDLVLRKSGSYMPGLIELTEIVNTGKYDGIVCTDLSRISRDLSTTFSFIKLLNKKKVELILVSENRSKYLKLKLISNISESLADYDNLIRGERIREGMKRSSLKKAGK